MEMDYEEIKEVLDSWENSIIFDFYDRLCALFDDEYCKNILNKAKSNDERLMVYMQLLSLYISVELARLRRLIEEKAMNGNEGLVKKMTLPSAKDDSKSETDESQKNPETYEF